MSQTTGTGAKKIQGTDDWRDIFDIHNDTVDAYDGAIGTTSLPTTAQTLTGAIAEHESDISTMNSKMANIETLLASSYITANEGSIYSGSIEKNINTCMLGVVLSGVTITNNTKLLTIIEGYGIRPRKPSYISVFNYDDGKPFNGCLYFTSDGKMTYYGDSISNKNLYVCATYIGEY